MNRLLMLVALVLVAMGAVSAAQATQPDLEGPNGEHQVVVCKYVGTPGVDEVLQTGQNPIVVDYHALLGAGFNGSFPFSFSDAQGQSIAVQWTADVQFSDLSVCPVPEDPPTMVEVCNPATGEIISVPEEVAGNFPGVDDPACQEEPPPPPCEGAHAVYDRAGHFVMWIAVCGPKTPPDNPDDPHQPNTPDEPTPDAPPILTGGTIPNTL